eukprot:2136691-Rhodomonas_salina.2
MSGPDTAYHMHTKVDSYVSVSGIAYHMRRTPDSQARRLHSTGVGHQEGRQRPVGRHASGPDIA